MITLISGTNRAGSKTKLVANYYQQYLEELQIPYKYLSLEGLDVTSRNETLLAVEKDFLQPANKFIFIIPEYNGSYPGILKLMMDHTDIRSIWWHKKALLTGVADGRAGNLRGLDHFTNVLNYLKINVYYNKLPISRINHEMDIDGNWKNEATPFVIQEQLKGFLEF